MHTKHIECIVAKRRFKAFGRARIMIPHSQPSSVPVLTGVNPCLKTFRPNSWLLHSPRPKGKSCPSCLLYPLFWPCEPPARTPKSLPLCACVPLCLYPSTNVECPLQIAALCAKQTQFPIPQNHHNLFYHRGLRPYPGPLPPKKQTQSNPVFTPSPGGTDPIEKPAAEFSCSHTTAH